MPEILQEADRLDKEAREIKKETFRICWYMRGMSYTEAMHLSHEERTMIAEIIKDNIETTKKTGLNFF